MGFSKGVRVRVTDPDTQFKGWLGTVTEVADEYDRNHWPVWVKLDLMKVKLGFNEDQIELLNLENLVEFFSQQVTAYVDHVPGIRAEVAARIATDNIVPVGHTVQPHHREGQPVDEVADDVMRSLDEMEESNPGVIAALGNRIGVRYAQYVQPHVSLGFDAAWAKATLVSCGAENESAIQRIRTLREASGRTFQNTIALGLKEARDLLMQIDPEFAKETRERWARQGVGDPGDQPVQEHQAIVLDTVVIEVQQEMVRQFERWGEQNHPDGTGPEETLTRINQTRFRMRATWPASGTGPEETLTRTNQTRFRMLAKWLQEECDRAAKDGTITWRHILMEEFFEAMAESDEELLLVELNQVAAVAASWRKAIRRRQARRAALPVGVNLATGHIVTAEERVQAHQSWMETQGKAEQTEAVDSQDTY